MEAKKKRMYVMREQTLELLEQIARHDRRGISDTVEIAIEELAKIRGIRREEGGDGLR